MLRTTFYTETMAAPARPVVLRLVRRDGRMVAPARRPPRPAWALLYALVPLTLAALVTIELLLPEGWGRSVAELVAVTGCIALTRLWIGCNRRSLVRTASQGRPEGAGLHAEPESDQEVG